MPSLIRWRAFDASTEGDRSKDRFRRTALTTTSAGGARVVGLLASLVTIPLTFSFLGPERYGLWMVLLSLIAAMGFADLGIGNGLVNAISEAYGKNDRRLGREYVTSAFVMLLTIAVVFAIAGSMAYLVIPWMRLFNVKSAAVATEGSRALVVLFVWFLLSLPLGVVSRVQAGLQKGYFPQIIGTLGSVATLLALLAVINLHGSLSFLVFGSIFGTIVSTLVNGRVLFREHPRLLPARHAYRKNSAIEIFKFGLMFFVLQCAFAVGYTSDNIVINQILGAAALAAYAVPQKFFGFVGMVIGMAVGPLWPAFWRDDCPEATWRGFVGSSLGPCGSRWVCTLLVFTGPWLLRVFFGKLLYAPPSLLVVLGVWGIVSAVSMPTSILLNGAGVLRSQTILEIVATLSNLALSLLLTRRFGVIRVCLGSITTQLLITFPTYLVLIPRLFRRLAVTRIDGGPKEIVFVDMGCPNDASL